MPVRPTSREQAWLLPPNLDELLPDDHPSRFVAAFVEGLDRAHWKEMGIDLEGDAMGAPSYHPKVLLCAWLYGFMRGIRSSRKIEEACRDQIPFLWLTGFQHPRPQHLVAFLQGTSASDAQLAEVYSGHGNGSGIGRSGGTGS